MRVCVGVCQFNHFRSLASLIFIFAAANTSTMGEPVVAPQTMDEMNDMMAGLTRLAFETNQEQTNCTMKPLELAEQLASFLDLYDGALLLMHREAKTERDVEKSFLVNQMPHTFALLAERRVGQSALEPPAPETDALLDRLLDVGAPHAIAALIRTRGWVHSDPESFLRRAMDASANRKGNMRDIVPLLAASRRFSRTDLHRLCVADWQRAVVSQLLALPVRASTWRILQAFGVEDPREDCDRAFGEWVLPAPEP